MLKVILYAYMNNVYSCRKIEKLLHRDIHYIWLAGYEKPDFITINRFRNRVKKDLNLVDGQLPRISQKGAGHGFGLWNVQDVLKKYGGEYTISCRGCWFRLTCTIPLRKL